MRNTPVLTVAVPTYNMERWLEKNLNTYWDARLVGRLEVICVNNDSTDRSKEIIESFCTKAPEIFRLIDRTVDDYGAAVNDAIVAASGTYFRIVDADDWVNTDELFRFVEELERQQADVILSDYQIVSMIDGSVKPVCAGDFGVRYGHIYKTLDMPMRTLPSIHATTYRTQLLRQQKFTMLNGLYFLDETYVIIPYLHVKSVLYSDCDVYRYQVANPEQSMSPKNRAKHHACRREILCDLIARYYTARDQGHDAQGLAYCRKRIVLGVGDHFTTLYMYIEDRKEGRALAAQWKQWLLAEAPEFWPAVKEKEFLLSLLSFFGISLLMYEKIKKLYYVLPVGRRRECVREYERRKTKDKF